MVKVCLYIILLCIYINIYLVLSENIPPDFIFFRKPHKRHEKLPYSCEDPEFCLHPTDNEEDLDEMEWPDLIKDYTHCMDLLCQCPAFKGTVKGNNCILPNGKVLQKAFRKELRQFTRKERHSFVNVMNKLHDDGFIGDIGLLHKTAGIHSGPAFFPWHREFFKRIELALRLHDVNLAIPYWDSTLDNYLPEPYNSSMFSYELMGLPDNDGYVRNTIFNNWSTMDNRTTWYRRFGHEPDGELINNNRINYLLGQSQINKVLSYSMPLVGCTNFEVDEKCLEYSHDYVHYFISGDMEDRITSSNDPIFYIHHSFIDYLWEMWRQKQQTPEQREFDWPEDNLECAPGWHFKNGSMPLLKPFRNQDALSNKYTQNLYTYAPRPTCKRSSEECDSEFLFCDKTTTPDDPHCVAKVNLHGNCEGFEWSDEICLIGTCFNGKCRQRHNPDSFPRPPTLLSKQEETLFLHNNNNRFHSLFEIFSPLRPMRNNRINRFM